MHVAELVRALRMRGDLDVRVHAFGEPRDEDGTTGHPDLGEPHRRERRAHHPRRRPASRPPARGLTSCTPTPGTPIAGHLASLMGDIPHVLTAHSSEPMRPWKAERLGGGYRVSSWVEKTAYEGPPTPSSR